MSVDRTRLYESERDFFLEKGSAIMKLTPEAAMQVCDHAAMNGMLVLRVEGGIYHDIGFEARIDCIWDSKISIPIEESDAHESNTLAKEFIESEMSGHNSFIITTAEVQDQR